MPVKVVTRIRPQNKIESSRGGKPCVTVQRDGTEVFLSTDDEGEYRFTFDRVFGPTSKQKDVFEYIEFEQVQEMFEEMVLFFDEPPEMEEEFEEMSFEPVLMLIEEMPMEEEIVMEEPMEEFYEETNEIVETFLPVVSEEETFSSEETFVETEGPIFIIRFTHTCIFNSQRILIYQP